MFLFLFVITDPKEETHETPYIEYVEYIYNKYFGFIVQKLSKLLPNCCDLEDLAQDVFLSLLKNNIRLEENDETILKKYLMIVCKHEAIRYTKKNKNIVLMPTDEIDATISSEEDTEEDIVSSETKDELVNIIMSLSGKNRDVCYLKYLLGLTNKEISKTLEIPESIVASRLFKSKKEIKAKYEKLK